MNPDATPQQSASNTRLKALVAVLEQGQELSVHRLDDTPFGIAVLDPEGRITDWNRQAEAMLPVEDGVGGTPFADFFARGEGEALTDLLQRCRQGERPRPSVLRTSLPRGQAGFLELQASLVHEESRVLGYLVFLQDATERRLSSEGFRRVMESAPSAHLMIDRDGIVTLVNRQAEAVFGYPRDELLGRSVEMLLPESLRFEATGRNSGFFRSPVRRALAAGRDLSCLRKDGREVPVEITLTPLQTREGPQVLASIVDVTERVEAAEKVLRSLREKEVLLREIHHRVKNNLAAVASLLYLQGSKTEDPETLRILEDCRDRVRSMALVHERLYRSEDLATIDFRRYAEDLASQLLRQYARTPGLIRLEVDFEEASLGIDQAIPCGLILTELVSNALNHAFPGGRTGTVRITFRRDGDGRRVLSVTDDGVGLQQDPSGDGWQSLGMHLVHSLAGQLDADFEILRRSPGTEVRLILKVPHGS